HDDRQLHDDERGVERVRADEQELALREVDDSGRLVDEHEAQRGERQDRALGQSDDEECDERAHARPLQTLRRARPAGSWNPARSTIRSGMLRCATVPSWYVMVEVMVIPSCPAASASM